MENATTDPDGNPSCPLVPPDGPRQAHRLESWSFFDDGEQTQVSIPHTWNTDQLDGDTSAYDRGAKRYRTTVEPTAVESRRLLHFEGANQTTTVRVDGETLGSHRGGYTAFTVDVTEALTVGKESVVEVVVDNSHDDNTPPLDADFTFFGGLYRPVWFVETATICLDGTDYGSSGVRVDTPKVSASAATVRVRADIRNHRTTKESIDLTHRVVDDGTTVAEFGSTVSCGPDAGRTVETVSDPLEEPALWSLSDPNCYTVETTVAVDGEVLDYVESPLGIREISLDEGRVTINGEPVPLRGTNRHQDRPDVGTALSDTDHRDDIRRIAELGLNFLRLAHYPQSHTVLDAADEHGLLLWEEIPVVNLVTDSAAFRENCRTRLEEMVSQHYNHPSVGIWGFMNEILLGYEWDFLDDGDDSDIHVARAIATDLDERLRSLDSTRLTAMACHDSPLYERFGFASIPDVLGWNLYHGWYYGEVEYVPGVLFEKNSTRRDQATMVSEYGVGADTRLHATDPVPWDFTEEYHSYFHEGHVAAFEEFPELAGTAQWSAFDFASDNRTDTIPGINQKGLSTFHREPKGVSHLYRAWQSAAPVVHIATRHWDRRSTAAARADDTHPVTVYSNRPDVELFLDGESLGRTQPDEACTTRWDVPLTPGPNHLEARAGDGNVTDETTVELVSTAVGTGGPFPEDGLAVDVGSHREIVTEGALYAPDREYEGEDEGWGAVGGDHVETLDPIFETDLDPLYQHAREGLDAYRVDLPPGTYRVTLGICDLENQSAGDRRFSVTANGEALVTDLDAVVAAGPRTPVTVDGAITVEDDGGLHLRFDADAGESLLNALHVERV